MAKRRLIVEPDKYVLLFNDAYTDYDGVEPVEIGKIVDTTTQKDVLYIYYNKNNYAENGYHVNIDVYEDENGEYPVANVDDMHRPCMFNDPDVFLSIMLHEYGHYINGDLNQTGLTNQQIQEDRLRCIQMGRVYEMERRADLFAVRYVGKPVFIRSMDYMIEQRKRRNDAAVNVAIREFELRKQAIKNL